ncbi:MAG TPA: universal stress protein [Saprospiraceae bacterium]|nr:universal stress protein [Saprospiraceae bacterium]
MNHIIVPVDLSKNSKDALRYAAHLAEHAGTDIMIVYSISLLQKVVNYTAGKKEEAVDPQKWILKRIKKIKRKHPGVPVDFRIIKGDTLDGIKKLIENTKADIVVMGTQGEGENPDTFLGSTSGALVKTTDIPVILIPPGFKFNGIDKVVFAAKDTFVKFMGALEPIISINQIFKPHVQLLHLGELPDPIPEQSFSILQVINDITRYGNDNFNESIHEYLSQHHADLLCVIRRKRGLIEKLLGPSKTLASKFSTDIPVLVLIGED